MRASESREKWSGGSLRQVHWRRPSWWDIWEVIWILRMTEPYKGVGLHPTLSKKLV